MLTLLGRRAILVTGKGGVGKTTVAAALAMAGARLGKRVLCTEVAPEKPGESPLSRMFGVGALSDEPIAIHPNLKAAWLTSAAGHRQFLRDALHSRMLADAALKSAAIRRFLNAAPTFAEMGVLYRILDFLRQTRSDGSVEHELLIVDLPATGHALGLAQIPAAVLRVISAGPIAHAIREGLGFLMDPNKTCSVVVTLPETLPVSEALELVAGIVKHGIPFANIVLNRIPHDPFGPGEREQVDSILRDHGPMLGGRTLPRIDRAHAAIARLRELSVPVAMISEVSEGDPVALIAEGLTANFTGAA